MSATSPTGPLVGVRVIEMSGKGPAPFCAMLLADMGADVIRIDRPTKPGRAHDNYIDPQLRGRRSVAVNLKNPDGVETVLKLVEQVLQFLHLVKILIFKSGNLLYNSNFYLLSEGTVQVT